MQVVHPPNPDLAAVAEPQSSAVAIRKALRFLVVLRRRKMIVFASLAAALLLGGFRYATSARVYQANSALLVQSTGSDPMSAETSFSGVSRDLETYTELFETDVVLSDAVQHIERPPPGINPNAPPTQWTSVLRHMISAKPRKGTSIIEVSCQSEDPKAAVSVLNAVVESYLRFMDKNHKNVALEIVRTLDRERESVRQQIEQKSQELIIAKQNSGDLSVGDSGDTTHPLLERVLRLNSALLETQEKRVRLQAALAGIQGELQSGGDVTQYLVDLEPTLGREFVDNLLGIDNEEKKARQRQLLADEIQLQSLQQHYGPAHVKIRELKDRVQRTRDYLAGIEASLDGRASQLRDPESGKRLLARVAKAVAVAQQQESAMKQEYLTIEAEAIKLNERLANVQIVQRDLDRLRNLHETILARIANIDINQQQASTRASVVRRAKTPRKPISPKLAKILPLCLFAGLLLGAGIVFVLDVLEDRFGSPEEISEQLGAPVLAMIRELPQSDTVGAESLCVHAAQEEMESEAFRTLRTALTFSGQERERLAITSSEPSDGKTTVIANLGASYAQAGKKTLLVDADMRKPGLTKLFDLRRQGGLSDVLRSTENVSGMCRERIVSSGVESLDILPCGPKPSNPSELLSGARLEELVAWAETTYDQILIDCPPILAASDAALVGRRTDGMVLVVQPEKNHRRLVLRAAEELKGLQVPLIGIVANRLTDRSEAGYGYGYGYGYGHGYGYGAAYGADDELGDSEHSRDESGAKDQSAAQRAA